MDRVPTPDCKVLLSPDYKEEQLRAKFLNPFFESLGSGSAVDLAWQLQLFASACVQSGEALDVLQ